MTKNFLRCALVIMVCFCITACSQDSKTTSEEVPVIYIGIEDLIRTSSGYDRINKKLAEISEKKYNFRIQLVWCGNEMQNSIAFRESTGRCIDVFSMYYQRYKSNLQKGFLLDMTPYLDQFGPSLKEVYDSKAAAEPETKKGIYGIPKFSSDINANGVVLSKKYVEKYNFDISTLHHIGDVEKFLAVIAEKEPDVLPWTTQYGLSVLNRIPFGDVLDNCLSMVKYSDKNAAVCNLYETKEYEDRLRMIRRWRERGYLSEHTARSEIGREEVAAGDAFATEIIIKPEETEYLQSVYKDQALFVPFEDKPVVNTANDWVLVWSVSSQTKYPREAITALNALYSDQDIITTINYGLEGTDYIENPDGSLQFPNGVTIDTVGYMNTGKWRLNIPKAKRWVGVSENLEEKMKEFEKSAVISPAYGFWFDSSGVSVDIAEIQSVIDEYQYDLERGMYPVDEKLPEFQDKLRAAGADILVKEVQMQVDAWKAAR